MRGHPDDDALTHHHDARAVADTAGGDAHSGDATGMDASGRDPAGLDPVGVHLTSCARCRTRLSELVALQTRLAALRDADVPSALLDRLTQVTAPDPSSLDETAPRPTVRVVPRPTRRRQRVTRPRRDFATTVLAHLSLLPPALTGGLAFAMLLGGAVVARQVVHAHENATTPAIAATSVATVSIVRRTAPQSTPAVYSTPALTATDRNYQHTTLAAGVTSLVPQVLTPTSAPALGVLNAVPDAPALDCLTALAQRNGADGVLAVDEASYNSVPVFLVVVRGRPLHTDSEADPTGQTAAPSSPVAARASTTGSTSEEKTTPRPTTSSAATGQPARASASPPAAGLAGAIDPAPSPETESPSGVAVTGFVVARSCTGVDVHLLDEVVVSG